MQKVIAVMLGLFVGFATLGPTAAQELTVEQEAKLRDWDSRSGFGYSVALDGDTAIIGAPYGDGDGAAYSTGNAHVYTRTDDVWTRQEIVFDTTRWAAYSRFGSAVALDGDAVIVGAPKWFYYFGPRGAAYSYSLDGRQLVRVKESFSNHERLGRSVAVSGGTAIVGTAYNRAYVLKRTSGGWVEQATLVASAENFRAKSVAIHGNTAIIGGPRRYDTGAAVVFSRKGGVWTEEATLIASDGTVGDGFGDSVAMDGNLAVIGAAFDNGVREDSGSAYVFSRTRGEWQESAKLQVSDDKFTRFGRSVAIEGDTILVGARLDVSSCDCCDRVSTGRLGCPDCPDCEAAICDLDPYCCETEWDSTCGGEAYYDCDCCADQEPGFCVQGDNWGAAFVFTRTGRTWTEQANLVPAEGPSQNGFGCSVSLDGDTAIVGAWWDYWNGIHRPPGSAYVYRLIRPESGDDGDGDDDRRDRSPRSRMSPESITSGTGEIRDLEPR